MEIQNPNIKSALADSINGVVIEDISTPLHGIVWTWTNILSINADTSKYDIAAFDYFIKWTKYSYPWSTANTTWFLVTDSFLLVWVDATWIVTQKNTFFWSQDLDAKIEIWALVTADWVVISSIWEDVFDISENIQNNAIRNQIFTWTIFGWSAWVISENQTTPLQLDITWWNISTPNLNTKAISSTQNIWVIEVYNVSGNYEFQAEVTPYTVNTTQYDNWTDLVTAANNKWLSHTILRSSRTWNIYMVFSTAEYDNEIDALDASVDRGNLLWEWNQVEPLCRLVFMKWSASITHIIDERNWSWTSLSASTSTLQNTYSRSWTSPQIITSTAWWAVWLQRWSATDADNVFEVKNGWWTITASIRWDGNAVVSTDLVTKSVVDTLLNTKANINNPSFTSTNGWTLTWSDNWWTTFRLSSTNFVELYSDNTTNRFKYNQWATPLSADELVTKWYVDANGWWLSWWTSLTADSNVVWLTLSSGNVWNNTTPLIINHDWAYWINWIRINSTNTWSTDTNWIGAPFNIVKNQNKNAAIILYSEASKVFPRSDWAEKMWELMHLKLHNTQIEWASNWVIRIDTWTSYYNHVWVALYRNWWWTWSAWLEIESTQNNWSAIYLKWTGSSSHIRMDAVTSAPSNTSNKLYNVWWALYWNWTDLTAWWWGGWVREYTQAWTIVSWTYWTYSVAQAWTLDEVNVHYYWVDPAWWTPQVEVFKNDVSIWIVTITTWAWTQTTFSDSTLAKHDVLKFVVTEWTTTAWSWITINTITS